MLHSISNSKQNSFRLSTSLLPSSPFSLSSLLLQIFTEGLIYTNYHAEYSDRWNLHKNNYSQCNKCYNEMSYVPMCNIIIAWHLFFVKDLSLPWILNTPGVGTLFCPPINHFPHLSPTTQHSAFHTHTRNKQMLS